MKIHTKFIMAMFFSSFVSTICLGFVLTQKLVTANENAYSVNTSVEAKGMVRRYIFDSLKSECNSLSGDYELIEYKFESFRLEGNRNEGWESFASARGTCDGTAKKSNRLVIASEDSYSSDSRSEAESDVRKYLTDSLKSECQSLDGDYEMDDYNFPFFECEKDESGGWECFADAKGICNRQ